MELGDRLGRNGVLYDPYYMDEWVLPGGGGGKQYFWAHKTNTFNHLLKTTKDGAAAIEHGNGLRMVLSPETSSTIYKRAVQYTTKSYIDINGNLTKSLDSMVQMFDVDVHNTKKLDSIDRMNESNRKASNYWINN